MLRINVKKTIEHRVIELKNIISKLDEEHKTFRITNDTYKLNVWLLSVLFPESELFGKKPKFRS